MAELNIDLSDVKDEERETSGGFKAFERGWYRMLIDQTDYLPTKSGDGKRLSITLLCLDGPNKGRLVFEGLNLENPSEMAQSIARRDLYDIAVAIGHKNPTKIGKSEEIEGKAMMVNVYPKAASEGYGDEDGMENAIGQHGYLSIEAHAKKHGNTTHTPAARATAADPTGGDDDPF
jgi:hypothetical protein